LGGVGRALWTGKDTRMARQPAQKSQTAKVQGGKVTKYLLSIPEDLRMEIRIEAITRGIDMSTYICSILRKRSPS